MDIVTIYNICRICQLPSVEPSNPLLSPCRCLGSIRFVHNPCLMVHLLLLLLHLLLLLLHLLIIIIFAHHNPCLMVHINLLISIMSIVLGNHPCIFRESVAIVEKKNLFFEQMGKSS